MENHLELINISIDNHPTKIEHQPKMIQPRPKMYTETSKSAREVFWGPSWAKMANNGFQTKRQNLSERSKLRKMANNRF